MPRLRQSQGRCARKTGARLISVFGISLASAMIAMTSMPADPPSKKASANHQIENISHLRLLWSRHLRSKRHALADLKRRGSAEVPILCSTVGVSQPFGRLLSAQPSATVTPARLSLHYSAFACHFKALFGQPRPSPAGAGGSLPAASIPGLSAHQPHLRAGVRFRADKVCSAAPWHTMRKILRREQIPSRSRRSAKSKIGKIHRARPQNRSRRVSDTRETA